VVLDRPFGQEQLGGDLGVAQSLTDQGEYLRFSGAQIVAGRTRPPPRPRDVPYAQPPEPARRLVALSPRPETVEDLERLPQRILVFAACERPSRFIRAADRGPRLGRVPPATRQLQGIGLRQPCGMLCQRVGAPQPEGDLAEPPRLPEIDGSIERFREQPGNGVAVTREPGVLSRGRLIPHHPFDHQARRLDDPLRLAQDVPGGGIAPACVDPSQRLDGDGHPPVFHR
jgi:hypothetical protein